MTKNIYIPTILILLLFISCSKQKRAHKKLAGTYKITQYRYQTPEGFSYYPTATGSVFFEMHDDTEDTYSISISYSHSQINGSRFEVGTYTLDKEAEKLTLTPILNGISQSDLKNDIIILTKDDLELGYLDSTGARHFYIFKK